MNVKGMAMDSAQKGLKAARNKTDSSFWTQRLQQTNKEVAAYRKDIISKHPDNILSMLPSPDGGAANTASRKTSWWEI